MLDEEEVAVDNGHVDLGLMVVVVEEDIVIAVGYSNKVVMNYDECYVAELEDSLALEEEDLYEDYNLEVEEEEEEEEDLVVNNNYMGMAVVVVGVVVVELVDVENNLVLVEMPKKVMRKMMKMEVDMRVLVLEEAFDEDLQVMDVLEKNIAENFDDSFFP